MLKYGVNVSMVFTEYPFAERVRKTAEAGFKSFEFLFPRQFDMNEAYELKEKYGLEVQLFDPNVPPDGLYERGYLCIPGPEAEAEFFRSLEEALEVARKLGTKRLNNLFGNVVPGVAREQQRDVALERLKRAAKMAASDGIMILIEALNRFDFPKYYLTSSKEGFEIVDLVDEPNVKFQYDLYHLQLMEGNLVNTMRQNIAKIGHIQIADVPGRHEPGTGEINYPFVLRAIEEMGYDGYIGLEYIPSGKSEDSLKWIETVR